jgi:putative ABC transport system permease protein
MRLGERLYHALLHLYPAEFRRAYRREMTQLYRDRRRHEPAWRVWTDITRDLIRTAPKEQFDVLSNDLRYAVRTIRRTPMFSGVVMLTAALGIGGSTAIFSVVNAVLLRPLPFANVNRLVQVAEKNDRLDLPTFGSSVLNFLSWRGETRTCDELAAIGSASFNLAGAGEPERFIGNRISPSLLRVLGVAPVAGRGFTNAEELPGAAAVAMIGERLWATRFGRDPSLVGRTLTLNGSAVTIVGIAPSSLSLFSGGEIYIPLAIDPGKENRLNHVILVVGRLTPGVSLQDAQAEYDTIAMRMQMTYPEMRDWGIHLVGFFDTFVSRQLENALYLLLASVALVLLIACANTANLFLARTMTREREIALRTALGASRSRLVRQLLVESLTLSVLGGTGGIIVAVWAVRAINLSLPPNLLPVSEVHVDSTVLLGGVALTIATGVLFGLPAAFHGARTDINRPLKAAARTTGVGRGRLRRWLVGGEVALATVLLIGAGLLVQTFMNLQRADVGFQAPGLLTFQLAPPIVKYPLGDKAVLLYREIIDAVRTIPGVKAAAVSSGIPFGQGSYTTSPVLATGRSVLPPDTPVPIDWRIVSPGYFATMGIPLLRGREFSRADRGTAPAVTIVSAATARTFWGGDDPIGRTLRRTADGQTFTVVGVVGDVRSTVLNQESPALYYSAARRVWPLMDVVVRSDVPPSTLIAIVRQKVQEIDPALPVATVRTMDEWVSNSVAQPRVSAQLFGLFAVVAVVIAAVGIYGVIAYSVSQRMGELGLRMILGAPRHTVVRLVVAEGMRVSVAGVGFGVLAAAVLGRTLDSLVYGLAPHDPRTLTAVACVLVVVALFACWLPARRAAHVDPLTALRRD